MSELASIVAIVSSDCLNLSITMTFATSLIILPGVCRALLVRYVGGLVRIKLVVDRLPVKRTNRERAEISSRRAESADRCADLEGNASRGRFRTSPGRPQIGWKRVGRRPIWMRINSTVGVLFLCRTTPAYVRERERERKRIMRARVCAPGVEFIFIIYLWFIVELYVSCFFSHHKEEEPGPQSVSGKLFLYLYTWLYRMYPDRASRRARARRADG